MCYKEELFNESIVRLSFFHRRVTSEIEKYFRLLDLFKNNLTFSQIRNNVWWFPAAVTRVWGTEQEGVDQGRPGEGRRDWPASLPQRCPPRRGPGAVWLGTESGGSALQCPSWTWSPSFTWTCSCRASQSWRSRPATDTPRCSLVAHRGQPCTP